MNLGAEWNKFEPADHVKLIVAMEGQARIVRHEEKSYYQGPVNRGINLPD